MSFLAYWLLDFGYSLLYCVYCQVVWFCLGFVACSIDCFVVCLEHLIICLCKCLVIVFVVDLLVNYWYLVYDCYLSSCFVLRFGWILLVY